MNELVLDKKLEKLKRNWSLEDVKKLWKKYLDGLKKKNLQPKVSFYIHIPFCRSRCEYCRHYLLTPRDDQELNQYLQYLIAKLSYFKNLFKNIKFKTLYIGGGTPSILSEKQLKILFKNLFSQFKFEKDGEKTFELNFINTSLEKLKILKEFGFNRLSFGVQSTNKKTLKRMNRGYQDFNLIKKIIALTKKLNFQRVNLDLIIGLYKESPKQVVKSFCDVAALRPDSIALYPLQPTKEYLEKYYQNDKNRFDRELRNKLKVFLKLIKPVALKYRYYLFFPPDPQTLRTPTDEWNFISEEYISKKQFSYIYDDTTQRINCFGIGYQSCSWIFNKLQYQEIGYNLYSGIKFPNSKYYKLYNKIMENKKSIKKADIKVGPSFNNNCQFCVQGDKKKFGNKKMNEIKNILRKASKDCQIAVFTGGEPTKI